MQVAAIDPGPEQQHPRYDQLLERAVDFVEARGGAVSEDQLIAYVFGAPSAPDLWRGLLRSILSSEPRLRQRPDNSWAIATSKLQSESDFPSEYIVVDVETTGLKPRHHRITEVAIISVAPRDQTMKWSSLVNPERQVPKYVTELTGIDDQKVAAAPRFQTVAPTVLEMIGERPIVGHNVDFDVSFLNAELKRCGYPALLNQRLDTMAIADSLLPDVRRLDLATIARALDLEHRKVHRALADAETTLAVLGRLRDRADSQGLGSFESLASLRSRKSRNRKASVPVTGRGRAILDSTCLDTIPHAPGVYVMRDDNDRVIYVGKAKDLRKRVGSYYSQPLGYTRKMDGLLEALTSIETEVVGSELEALILESQLIRRYNPRFNTAQRNVEQYAYIKVDIANPWPRVTMAREYKDDDARYFGPFRSTRQVRDAVRLINDILPLRTCRRSFKDWRSYGSACIELSLRRCMGPCTGGADRDAYRQYVHDVIAFFSGDRDRLVSLLHDRLEASARNLDYERAARLRDQMSRLERLSLEQAQLDEAAATGHALLVLPGATPDTRQIWYLLRGRRWAQIEVERGLEASDLASRLDSVRHRAVRATTARIPDYYSIDETAVLWRWLRRTPDHPAFIPWNDGTASVDVARRVLEVDMSVPFGEQVVPSEVES